MKTIKSIVISSVAIMSVIAGVNANARTVPQTESNYASIELDILEAQSADTLSAPVAKSVVKTSNRPTAEEDALYRGNSH